MRKENYMKKKFKLLAIILTVLITVLCLPVNALASDISEPDESSSTEVSSEASESSAETTVETETMIFEFTEEEAPPINSRMIGDGEVDLNPPAEEYPYARITSAEIPEGVYSLQNLGSGKWMSVELNATSIDYNIQQISSTTNPASTFTRACLFKISKNSDGQYIIRLMTNNRLTLGLSGTDIVTEEISPIDSEVDESQTFTIACISGNYVICPTEETSAVSANGSAVINLVLRSLAQAGNYAHWKLYKYNGAHKSSTTVYYTVSWETTGISVGTTGYLSNKTWSTHINANYPYMCVANGYEDMMSCDWEEDIYKMKFTALSPGKVRINTQILVGDSNTVQHSGYAIFQVIPQEGTYLIRNNGTTKYVDIEGPSVNEGALIHQWEYSEKASRRWIIEHVSGGEGYVRIKSEHSNKYLGVDSTDTTVIKQTSAQNNYTLWKFERTSAGNLKLICKAYDETLVLAPSSNATGADLILTTYTDNSDYTDEWVNYLVQYSYTLHHYYDHGYDARFTDNNSTALEKIKIYHNAVSERLMQIFGVITYGEYSLFESSADLCKKMMYGEDDYLDYVVLEENCSHGENSSNIHLTRTDLQDDLSRSNILTSVVWTGYIMPGPKSSVSFERSIVMTPLYTTEKNANDKYLNLSNWNEVKWNSIYSFIHEVGHTLGAPDHYCYDSENRPCYNNYCDVCVNNTAKRECIMSCYPRKNIDEISNEDLFCQDCLQTIRAHLEDHH